MKGGWNQSADILASAALHRQHGMDRVPREAWDNLEKINWLPELLVLKNRTQAVRVATVTRSRTAIRVPTEVLQGGVVR